MQNDTNKLIRTIIDSETERQNKTLSMLASENTQSEACLSVQASVFANKTLEGFPGRRYHAGAANADALENLCIEKAMAIFGAAHANVQPHSGSQANHVVYHALLEPHDNVLALSLEDGGHLSHGARVNITNSLYKFTHFGVSREDGFIDYDEMQRLAMQHMPRLIVCGGSSYPRFLDFPRISAIARDVGARLLIDMAHFAGQVAAGRYPSPFPYADVVTTTTYKGLKGPRGAIILSRDENIGRKIDRALFPGYQGTPSFQIIAAKAICLHEVSSTAFQHYIDLSLRLAQQFSQLLFAEGYCLVTGGTDTSMIVLDIRDRAYSGREAVHHLEQCGIIANQNVVPGEVRSPMDASGIRFSTNSTAARGIEDDASQIFDLIVHTLNDISHGRINSDQPGRGRIVETICSRHPVPIAIPAVARAAANRMAYQ